MKNLHLRATLLGATLSAMVEGRLEINNIYNFNTNIRLLLPDVAKHAPMVRS